MALLQCIDAVPSLSPTFFNSCSPENQYPTIFSRTKHAACNMDEGLTIAGINIVTPTEMIRP